MAYGYGQYGGNYGAVSGGAGEPPTINGIAIGQEGGNGTEFVGVDLTGFRLEDGDDFNAMPSRFHPVDNPSGKYLTGSHVNGKYYNGGADQMVSALVNPYWRGARSENGTPLGFDRLSIEDGAVKMDVSAPSVEEYPFLPANVGFASPDGNGKPQLLNSVLQTLPRFAFSAKGSFALFVKMFVPTGIARGHWAAPWTTGEFWPDYAEIDFNEYRKASNGIGGVGLYNVIASSTNGGGAIYDNVATPTSPSGRWVTTGFIKDNVAGNVRFYDDIAVEGTLALRGSTTTRFARIRGIHEVRLQMQVSNIWDTSTFNLADWPSYAKYAYWQAWVPTTAGPNTSLNMLPVVETTPGGSWAATIPSAASISGGAAGLEQIYAVFDWLDAPGAPGFNGTTHLPGGMTVDATARTVSGTVPATEGGRVLLAINYSYDDGTPVKRTFLPFDVAPAPQATLMGNIDLVYDEILNQDIVYTDFHSGNLGPHTYSVVVTDGPWITVTGNGTSEVNLSIVAPSSDSEATIEITCTNAKGQATVVSRTATVAAALPVETVKISASFTAASGTALTAYSPEIGSSWSSVSGVAGSLKINAFGKLAPTAGQQIVKSNTAVSGSLRVELVANYKATANNMGVSIRVRATSDTDGYQLFYNQNTKVWALGRIVGGAAPVTLTTLSYAPGGGVDENVKLEISNDGNGDVQIDVYLNDVLNATLSTVDSHADKITTDGDFQLVGYYFGSSAVTFDNLVVTELA